MMTARPQGGRRPAPGRRIEREFELAGVPPAPGTMVPSSERSLVVLDMDGEVAVALGDLLDRALVVVKHAYQGELADVASSCRPWPWMVVGAVPELPEDLAVLLRKPVLTAWLGDRPSGLPPHARAFARFADLAGWVDQSLRSGVAGMFLAIGSGVDIPGVGHVRSAALQALVSAGSSGFDLSLRSFQGAARALAARHVPVRPHPDPVTGWVCLRSAAP